MKPLVEGAFSILSFAKIRLEIANIYFKCPDTLLCYFTNRLRIIILELFRHINISGIFQFLNLYTQVAGSRVCFPPDKSELGPPHTDKK